MTEAHEGQMAENQAGENAVKDFAKTLVQDHTQSYELLTMLAAKTGVSIPKGSMPAKTLRSGYWPSEGAAFDHQFARDEIAAHRLAICDSKREADSRPGCRR